MVRRESALHDRLARLLGHNLANGTVRDHTRRDTYTEQNAVGREELDAGPAIKQIDFALCDNCVWVVLCTVVSLTLEDVKSKLKALRGQFDVMFNFYSPLVHPAHHFIAGPLALNTKILQYGTVRHSLFHAKIQPSVHLCICLDGPGLTKLCGLTPAKPAIVPPETRPDAPIRARRLLFLKLISQWRE